MSSDVADRCYRAERPERYMKFYPKYKAGGGLIDIEEDAKRFAPDGLANPDLSRFYFFSLAFDQLRKEGISGDVAELGVFKGYTATVLAAMARRMGTTAYFLDTFEGFAKQDLVGIDEPRKMGFSETSLEAVRSFVGEENTRFIRGYFPETAAQLPADGRFCLVHIDCDLYAPTRSALEYFYPRLLPGGYLIVHDYASLGWDGVERAVDVFFAGKPEAAVPLADRHGSVCIRKARDENWLLRKRVDLLGREWKSAGRGALLGLLEDGWYGPEVWGTWGTGPIHTLHIVIDTPPPPEGVWVAADVACSLSDTRPSVDVKLNVGDTGVATWSFTKAANRGERRVRLPAEVFEQAGQSFYSALLAFRPGDYADLRSRDPALPDYRIRTLGLHGLCRIA